MAMLDGEAVYVEDTVFDIINGIGTVVHTTNDTMDVVFKNSKRMSFKGNGLLGSNKRLFWQKPVVAVPCKDPKKWQYKVKVVASVMDFLDNTGEPEDEPTE